MTIATKSRRAQKPPARERGTGRRAWLLRRLLEADGITYDELCRAVVGAFPEKTAWWSSVRGVRAVRDLMSAGLVTTESDESCWLTAAGWAAAERVA